MELNYYLGVQNLSMNFHFNFYRATPYKWQSIAQVWAWCMLDWVMQTEW